MTALVQGSAEHAAQVGEAVRAKASSLSASGRQSETARAISLIFGVKASITTGPG